MNKLHWKNCHPVLLFTAVAAAITAAAVIHRFHDSSEEIAFLKNELREAEAQVAHFKPLAARAHEMPVEIRRRRVGEGQFVVINQTRAPLPVTIDINGGSERSAMVPKASGWLVSQAKPGDRVEISSPGFDPIIVIAR